MKVLLTGASGFVGRHIAGSFAGHQVVTLGRSPSHDVQCDLAAAVPVLSSTDLVVHAAGRAHSVPRTPSEALAFFGVNTAGTANLLSAIDRTSLPASFVFISSVAVYGREAGVAIDETTTLAPRDAYGESKRDAEALITSWCAERSVRCAILRLPLVAGPNPPGNLGAMIRGVRRGYYVNVAGGTAAKSVVLAEDVAAVVRRAAEMGGVYNLTDGNHPTLAQLGSHIARQLQRPAPLNIPYGAAAVLASVGDFLGPRSPLTSMKLRVLTSSLTFDDRRARAALEWRPTAVLDGFRIT